MEHPRQCNYATVVDKYIYHCKLTLLYWQIYIGTWLVDTEPVIFPVIILPAYVRYSNHWHSTRCDCSVPNWVNLSPSMEDENALAAIFINIRKMQLSAFVSRLITNDLWLCERLTTSKKVIISFTLIWLKDLYE